MLTLQFGQFVSFASQVTIRIGAVAAPSDGFVFHFRQHNDFSHGNISEVGGSHCGFIHSLHWTRKLESQVIQFFKRSISILNSPKYGKIEINGIPYAILTYPISPTICTLLILALPIRLSDKDNAHCFP